MTTTDATRRTETPFSSDGWTVCIIDDNAGFFAAYYGKDGDEPEFVEWSSLIGEIIRELYEEIPEQLYNQVARHWGITCL